MVTTRGMAARMAMENQAPAGHTVQQQPENPRRSRVKRERSAEQEEQVDIPHPATGAVTVHSPKRKMPQITYSRRSRIVDLGPSIKDESPSNDGKVFVESEGDTASGLHKFDPLTQAGDDATSYLNAGAAVYLTSFVREMGHMIAGPPTVPSGSDASRTAGGTVAKTSGERTDDISGGSLLKESVTMGRRSRRSAGLSKEEPN
ncbi:hypothetical protein NCC49_004095 [Naganishia albida]|nr:hypothetical protein NCC49_004095 [Naganishia albida]